MAFLEPELEPAGQFALKRALIPLGLLVGFTFAYGACKTADALTRALFGTISGTVAWIPWLGNVLEAPVHRVQQKITSLLGAWAVACQEQIGDALHELTALVHALGSAIANSPLLLYALAKYVLTLLSIQQWRRFYNSLVGVDRATLGAIKVNTKATHAAQRQAHAATSSAAVAHRAAIAVPGQIAHEWDIPKLRERVKELEDGATDTWKWITHHPAALASGAFAGAVAWALARIGAGWTRCAPWQRIGRDVCRSGGLEAADLIGALLTVEALANLRTLVRLAQDAEHGVAVGVKDLLDV